MGILGVPVRHNRNPDPGIKNQKVLHGTFPVEGGGRTQRVQNSFRRSPGSLHHAHKRVVRGVVRSKHARRRHGRSADKMRQLRLRARLRRDKGGEVNGLPSIARLMRATEGSSEKGFTMRARGRTRHTHLSWLQKITATVYKKSAPNGANFQASKLILRRR